MLSVVEQRAGMWGALLAGASDATAQGVPVDQESPVDISTYGLPSVRHLS